MTLCCQRYKTINAFHSLVSTEILKSYPSFGHNFREASTNMPREDFGPLIHRSVTFGLTEAADGGWDSQRWWCLQEF